MPGQTSGADNPYKNQGQSNGYVDKAAPPPQGGGLYGLMYGQPPMGQQGAMMQQQGGPGVQQPMPGGMQQQGPLPQQMGRQIDPRMVQPQMGGQQQAVLAAMQARQQPQPQLGQLLQRRPQFGGQMPQQMPGRRSY